MYPVSWVLFQFRQLTGKQIIGYIMVAMGFALLVSPTPPISTAAYIRDTLHIPLFVYSATLIMCGVAIATIVRVNDTLDFVLTLPFLFWCGFVVANTLRNNSSFTAAVAFIGLYILSLKITGDE